MKKLCSAMLTAATLIAGTATAADNKASTPAPAAAKTDAHKVDPTFDLSIRYVDSYTAIRESEEGKLIAKDLEKKRDELTKEIKAMEEKFAAAAKDVQAKISTMSESGREREQKNMAKMERDYKAKLEESDQEMKLAMQSAQERLLREHNDAVYKYARANNVDLIFGPGGVVYASEKANCTFDVVKNMDNTYVARNKGAKSQTAVAANTKKSAAATA